MMGRTRRDRITNVNIRETWHVADTVEWIQERRQVWNDRVDKMDDDRLVKTAGDSRPRIGRPRTRWDDSIQ